MSQNKTPFIIAFSGQNGCGKSTIISQLKDSIELSSDITVDVFKAPLYISETGEKIRSYLAGKHIEEDIEDLFHKNRIEVQEQVKQSTADVILLDRWILDAITYARFRNTSQKFDGELIPNLTVYVTAHQKILMTRLAER
jgi:thymidylate kinase